MAPLAQADRQRTSKSMMPMRTPMTMPAMAPPLSPPPPFEASGGGSRTPSVPTGGRKGTVAVGAVVMVAPPELVGLEGGVGDGPTEGSKGELPASMHWPSYLHACAAVQQMVPQADSPRLSWHWIWLRDVGAETNLLPTEVTVTRSVRTKVVVNVSH
ncbi:hypothetical protein ACKS0A_11832 [Histoplasma ohiense]